MKKFVPVLSLIAATAISLCAVTGNAIAGKPNIMESCKLCHKEAPAQTLRGKITSVSESFKSFNISTGPVVWIVKYDENLKVKEGEKFGGKDALKAIKKDQEVFLSYVGEESNPIAVQLAVKQPYKIPADQLISLDELKKLKAMGSDFTLVDSRPPAMYAEGHIPGAVSIPYAKFSELSAKLLPNNRSSLVIFYCAGET